MSDWRGGDNKDDNRRKDNKHKSKPLPVILPKQAASASGTRPSTKDWRGNAKSRSPDSAEGDRNWTGARREKVASTSGLKKSILVGLLGLTILSLFAAFLFPLFMRNPELPVVISITGTHASDDIGENPFGQQTIKQIQDAKPPSLKIITSTEASDQFLRVVKANEEWAKNFSGTIPFVKSGKIKGAGPGKNVMVYFVSCIVARADSNGKQSDEWVLLSRDDDPYWQPSKNSDSPLPISLFLERIAKQTATGSYAWIVFDVKPPTVVTNLGDLEFSEAAFDRSFKSLDKQFQDRLILSLPCQESQESWMAPEFSSSVFAHFFWQGIASGFDTENGIVTLDNFESRLKQKVQEWVALNRFARQTPTFLMSDATKNSKKDIKLLDMAGKPFPIPPSATNIKEIESKFRELDELWTLFFQLRHCMRWEPMKYAKIESQLIQMEELGECNAQYKWDDFKKRVESDLENLKRDSKFTRRVSLIESRQHSEVRPSVFIDVLGDHNSRETPWIVNSTDANTKPKEPDLRNVTPRDSKCFQVWSFLESEAKTGNASNWEKSFNKKHLSECLAYCDLQKEPNRSEWLEIQVLRIVLDAMKSESDSSKSYEAIARTIGTVSNLNEIAFDSNAELSRWTKKPLFDLDKQFLKAFDLLVANQFDLCIQQLQSMQSSMTKLRVDSGTLKEAMSIRDEVLWLTPHFLAAWMRDFRYSSKEKEIIQAARELGTVLTDAMLLRDSLEDADRPDKSLSLKPSTRLEFEKLKANLNHKFVELANKTEGDAETIPSIRIALRWPLLPLDLREKFHSRLTKLYAVDRSAGNGVSDVKHRLPSSISTEFCKGLNGLKGKSFYQDITSNDPRLSSLAMIEKDSPRELSSEPNKIVTAIYGVSYSTRMIANSFGQRAAASRPRDEDWRWPWNSATQFYQINTAYYNQLQSERLCLARWGDGNLDKAQPLGRLYFQRLEKEFALASSIQSLRNFDQAEPVSRQLEKAYAEYNKNADEEVKRLAVSIPVLERDTESDVLVSLDGNAWKAEAIATLSVHREETLDRRFFSNRTKTRSAGIRLNENDKKGNLNLDSSLVTGDKLRVSVRGNYRESRIVSKDDANSYQIRFERPPTKPSTIHVTAKSDPITLWVLLDCSKSMSHDNIHRDATATAKFLLNRIQELNESGECPINVGLIAFGRQPDDQVPTEMTQCSIGNQIFKSQIKTGEKINDLVELVRDKWIQPSGCTPLYDAIYTACESSKSDGRNWIVVISDGSNDVDLLPAGEKDDGTYYITKGGDKNAQQLKQKIIESKSSLFIFQYLNDRFYREAKRQNGTLVFTDEKRAFIAKANLELRALLDEVSPKKPGGTKSKLFYNDFKSLNDDLSASLPYSTVTVDSRGKIIGNGRFGQNIELPVKEPIDATVKIQSFGQTASTAISLMGSEGLKFIYSDSAGLDSIKFNDDRLTHGLGTDFSRMSSSGENSLRVFAKSTPHSDSSQYQLVLQVAIQGTAAENIEQKVFTRRPAFFLAASKPAGGGPETSTLISDTGFLQMTHYPIMLFPNIPWKQDDKWLSEQIDFDVWMGDKLPDKAIKVSLKIGDQQELLNKMITCSRTGNEVTVQIHSKNADRFFVICKDAKAATRTMVEGKETEAKFELQDDGGKPVEVVVLKESDLKQSVQQGSVKHYWINEMKFKK